MRKASLANVSTFRSSPEGWGIKEKHEKRVSEEEYLPQRRSSGRLFARVRPRERGEGRESFAVEDERRIRALFCEICCRISLSVLGRSSRF